MADNGVNPTAVDAIAAVCTKYPELCASGMGVDTGQARSPIDAGQFERAVFWITLRCKKLSRVSTVRSSYAYKHLVEKELREANAAAPGVLVRDNRGLYVSNGAFISAALHLGYRIERTYSSGGNVYLNMSVGSKV